MSFYVTLPSNGANLMTEEDLKKNTKTDFVINFDHPLDLKYFNYEVALVEIWFPFNWKVNYGSLQFKYIEKNQNKIISNIDIEWYDGLTAQKFVNHLNSLINPKSLFLVDGILTNHIIKAFASTHFTLNATGSLIIELSQNIELTISGFIIDILVNPFIQINTENFDLNLTTKFLNENIIIDQNFLKIIGSDELFAKFDFLGEKLNIITEIFIYTDIIDYQYVAQTSAQLLSVVSVNNLFNNTCHSIFVSPHYLPILDNKIESIRIFMRDSLGNKIKFSNQNSNVIYKLHFKPKS